LTGLLVSIVLYKTDLYDLKNCIKSVRKFLPKQEIIFIDNSPKDFLRKYIYQFDNVEYIHQKSNPGYGAAHNIAIKKSIKRNYEYHLVLNADVYFKSDVINEMINFMEKDLLIGNIMPKILNSDGSIQRLCKLIPRPFDLIKRIFFSNSGILEKNYEFSLKKFNYDKIAFIPYLSGCFMLLRVETIKAIGMFDERFFMYPEDLDLSRRIAFKYKSIFYPNCEIYHRHGAVSKKNIKMFLIHAFNMIIYFNKWGWIKDKQRDMINKKTIRMLSVEN